MTMVAANTDCEVSSQATQDKSSTVELTVIPFYLKRRKCSKYNENKSKLGLLQIGKHLQATFVFKPLLSGPFTPLTKLMTISAQTQTKQVRIHLKYSGKQFQVLQLFYSILCAVTCIGYLLAACTNPGYLQGCTEEIQKRATAYDAKNFGFSERKMDPTPVKIEDSLDFQATID